MKLSQFFQIFVIVFNVDFLSFTHTSDECYPIIKCEPDTAALDHQSINKTFEIICEFRNGILDDLDIVWKVRLDKVERLAYNHVGETMPPFKHEIRNKVDPISNRKYAVSVLKVPLLNSSYYTNYSIWSISGQCHKTVKINLKEKALGYTSGSLNKVVNMVGIGICLTLFFVFSQII